VDLLKKIDKVVKKIIENVCGTIFMLLAAIIIVTVISRYFLHLNLGGWEELPTMLMVALVWIGCILVAREDNMIKIDLIHMVIKSERVKQAINLVNLILSSAITIYFVPLTYQFLQNSIKRDLRSAAVGFPMWPVHGLLFVGMTGMAVYFVINAIKTARGLTKWS